MLEVMPMKNNLTIWQARLASHTKTVLLVLISVSLTTMALMMAWGYVQQKEHVSLIRAGTQFQSSLAQTIANDESELPTLLSYLAQNPSDFDQSSQHVLDSYPHFLRLELRSNSGQLMGVNVSSKSKEQWIKGSRHEVPPGVVNSFFKSVSEQRIYWTQSYAPSGESALEAIVPMGAKQQVLLVRFDPNHWLQPQIKPELPSNIHVSLSGLPAPITNETSSFSIPIALRGTTIYLEFRYKIQRFSNLDAATLFIFVLGLSLVFLLVIFNTYDTKARRAEMIYSQQVLSMFKSSQLSTLGEISTALSHELNQPLATITNHIATCEIRLKQLGHQDKALDEALHNAREQALRAGEVVHSIRQFLKRGPSVDATVDYENTISELMPIIRAMVKESKASIEVITESDLCARIDPSLFEQIVINLCKNGLDSMEHLPTSERKLIIHAHSFNDLRGVEWARVDVIDRGHGVKDEDASKLFESFFTTKKNGLGIGLNLCRSIAQSYQGHIVWANNDGGGATFSIELPKLSNASNNTHTTAI